MYVNWEGRPAITNGAAAMAVLIHGEDMEFDNVWTGVSAAEVGDSGKLVDEAQFRDLFAVALRRAGEPPWERLEQA